MWRGVAAGLIVTSVLGGCAKYSADLSFARAPGLGFRNAGLYTTGYLFLWDSRANKLTKIQDDIFIAKQPITEPPTDISSTNIRGISITGDFGSAEQKISAQAALGQKIQFTAEQAQREKYQSVYSALAQTYTSSGSEIRQQWYVNDVTRKGSGLYYVVITGIVRANKTTIAYGGEEGPEIGGLSVTVPGKLGTIKVSIKSANSAECSGKASPCFFDAMVISPFISDKKTLDFRAARGVDLDMLSEAFRGS